MRHINKPMDTSKGYPFFFICIFLAVFIFFIALPGRTSAAIIGVGSLADTQIDGDHCTLRAAIMNANFDNKEGSTFCAAGSGADIILFGPYLSGTITLGSALPSIRSDITIVRYVSNIGVANVITISGNNKVGVLAVDPNGVLTLQNLNIVNGNTSGLGGGIFNNGGIVTVTNSTFSGNGSSDGGAILNNKGTMTVTGSTFSDNRAFDGAAISNVGTGIITSTFSPGDAIITNSTFFENIAENRGGSINSAGGTLLIRGSTFSGNDANPGGGGSIFNDSGSVTLRNTILTVGTYAPKALACGVSMNSAITDGGYNIDNDGSCGLSTANHSKPKTDPLLDPARIPLMDNGGRTKTIALCTGVNTPAGCKGISPAIDAIPIAECHNPLLGTDQRGFFRPADGDNNGTALCDIGAFEAGSAHLFNVNNLVNFVPIQSTFQTLKTNPGVCPDGYVGAFKFDADLTDEFASSPLTNLVAEVTTVIIDTQIDDKPLVKTALTNGDLVGNADGGPGGVGATVTFTQQDDFSDGVLTSGEHVQLPFTICLKNFNKFTFFVDMLSSVTCSIPTFKPGYWNDGGTIQASNNCYNYANNKRTDTRAVTGRAANATPTNITCESIKMAAVADGLIPSSESETCPDNRTKIAFAVTPPGPLAAPHFYRLDSNGKWSQKDGALEATNHDDKGNEITDPKIATANSKRYTIFCGYLCACSDKEEGKGHENIK